MSKDVREIIIDAKKGKGKIAEILSSQTENMAKELERAQMERILEEEKQKLQGLRQQQGRPLQTGQAQNFLQSLFAGRSPEEFKAILDSLEPEHIDKIVAMNGNAFSELKNVARNPSSDSKTVLEAVKTGVEVGKAQSNQGVDLKGIAEIFKAGVEAARVQNPAQPQQNVYETLVKTTLDELKATREQMATQEKLRIEKEIAELRARPSGIDDLLFNEEKVSRARKIFGGTDSATANEFTLKKEDMQQKERLETRRMDIEEKALDHKLATEGKTIDQITNLVKTVSEGAVGDAIKMIGGAQADKMRGSVANSNSPRIVRVKCPSCGGIFSANEKLATLACPLCGAGLERGSQPAPQEPQPQATQSPEKTQESQAQTEQPPAEGQSVAEQHANQQ